MAIVNPVRDDRRTMLTTNATTMERMGAPLTSDLTIDQDDPPTISERITEPLGGIGTMLDEEAEGTDPLRFLSENDEETDEEESEELSSRARRVSIARTKHATGAEDAFQSYLRDIRGLGLLTHEEEIDLARRSAAGDELARRKLIESNLRLVIAIA